MSTSSRATWLFPWDLSDLGIKQVSDLLIAGQVGAANVATSYHSLFATVPDNPRRRHLDLPGSAVYFRPDPSVWAGATIQPRVSPMVDEIGDALALARELADSASCAASAWTVCLHDTSLGHRHSDVAAENLWGERLTPTPCLRNVRIRDHARRLVTDVSNRADVVQLESACWTTLPHHRHAKVPARSPQVVARLSELCFCQSCRAAVPDVDLGRLVAELRVRWQDAHSAIVSFAEIVAEVQGFASFLRHRTQAVTDLVSDLVNASAVPVQVVSFGDRDRTGMHLADLEKAGAAVWLLCYGPTDAVARMLAEEAVARDRANRPHVALSLLPEHTASAAELTSSITAAVRGGAVSLGTYHLGLATAQRRAWLPLVPAAEDAAKRTCTSAPGAGQ